MTKIEIGKKFGQMVLLLILLSVIVFSMARLCPGDPLKAYYGDGVERMSEMEREAAREKLGLNDSMVVQYKEWATHALQGDLGLSYQYKRPVQQIIGDFLPNTLILGLTAFVLTFAGAIWLGTFCAMRENSLTDSIICKLGVISGNIPSFFMALVLILIFAVNLQILPSGGAYSLGNQDNVMDRIYHLILPVTVLVLEHLWYYAFMVRNKLMEETRKDYVLLCKAEGIPRKTILRKHCLKNIMPSMAVMMAIAVPHILGGTYVVESVFAYPGLGTLSFQAAMYQDYNMLMALCLLTGVIVVGFNFLARLIGEWLDPRMQYEAKVQEVTA